MGVKAVAAISSLCIIALLSTAQCKKVNNRPIIGVLAETTKGSQTKYGFSFIAASYVKLVESAGARAAPVLLHQPRKYYEKMFNSLNGLVIPGGGQNLTHSYYHYATSLFFDMSLEASKKGIIFPVWGICLGFEMLNLWVAKKVSALGHCDSYDLPLPLDLKTPNTYKESRVFKYASKSIIHTFETKNVTANYHHRCITPKAFKKYKIDKILKPLSYNKDRKGKTFISTVEGISAPLYGTQWHPEKNLFVFTRTKSHRNTPHDKYAILASQYIANFFVGQARKSSNKFHSHEEEEEALIYNYDPIYVGPEGSIYEQLYIFPKGAADNAPAARVLKEKSGSTTSRSEWSIMLISLLSCSVFAILANGPQ